ncbi:Trm112 family protein [Rummeliibacillus suwonensis]|uniref:Trm112 family protein n=1 Tax=Rummeliibacillus suwonensis TaxID=1306154 RepID=UPI001AAF1732|nr:Trm112 family protein [Rummeliibacillus suwonensis]MBO2534980.1 hypothetical protein [Rummeliibacillus suwonensis]
MREETIKLLACPNCKHENLSLKHGNIEMFEKEDITEGMLYCNNCNLSFNIVNGIPYMLLNTITIK